MTDPLHKLLVLLVERRDQLRHFAKDKPAWRLAALCIIKLPMVAVVICITYWQTHRGP